jgi:hypothetical protein
MNLIFFFCIGEKGFLLEKTKGGWWSVGLDLGYPGSKSEEKVCTVYIYVHVFVEISNIHYVYMYVILFFFTYIFYTISINFNVINSICFSTGRF